MKNRKLFGAALLCALAILTWLLWSHTARQPMQTQGTPEELSRRDAQIHTPPPAANIASRLGSPEWFAEKENQRAIALEQGKDEWRTPINFFGKIVDERGLPVTDAHIDFGWTDLSLEGHSRASTTSDAHGMFSLERKSGKHLSVRVTKEGYYSSERDIRSFFYAGMNDGFSLALKNDGTVVAWGFMDLSPATVPTGLSNVVAIAAGSDFCLAITTNSAVADKFRGH